MHLKYFFRYPTNEEYVQVAKALTLTLLKDKEGNGYVSSCLPLMFYSWILVHAVYFV